MTRHKRHRPKLRSLYQWHRYLGLAVALLAVLLAVTGTLLNHTERLGLDQRQLSPSWLLRWYGIEPQHGRFFPAEGQWLSQWGDHLYLDDHPLTHRQPTPLLGVVRLPQMLVAASRHSLLLFTPEGILIERMEAPTGISGAITAIAKNRRGELVLQSDHGAVRGHPDEEQRQSIPASATWSQPQPPPPALQFKLAALHPGPSLPLERIILDLHSGRLFGKWGSTTMDIAAILLLFNAASGMLIWWRRRHQQRQSRRASL